MNDADLRAALSAIEPRGRELLRRYLIADQPDRDAIATELLHYDDEAGDEAYARRMGDGWQRMGFNRELDEGRLEEIHSEDRERAAREHLADEVQPTWWVRVRRRLRRSKA